MKHVHVISVGRLKEVTYLSTEKDYYKRISTFKVDISEVKSHNDQVNIEASAVIKRLNEIKKKQKSKVILLTERGKKHTSPEFSQWLYQSLQQIPSIILIIGGSAGHGKELYEIADFEISLSSLTFPHHMVRAILAEQLYRAETLYQGHPYSK
jgi:23S rRNA (pseudouridine1915-N3)-methyltransferase